MTEGIIQEVFNKYRPIRKGNGNYPYFTPKIFLQIQQELIEKIKQELTHAGCNTNCKYHMKKLIGDNND